MRSFVAVPNTLLPDRRRSLRDLLAEVMAQAFDVVRLDLCGGRSRETAMWARRELIMSR